MILQGPAKESRQTGSSINEKEQREEKRKITSNIHLFTSVTKLGVKESNIYKTPKGYIFSEIGQGGEKRDK